MMPRTRALIVALCLMSGSHLTPVGAQPLEKVTVATTALGLWDTSQPTFCKNRGEFAKAGLDVEVISTRGGSENVQAVIAGGADIGYSPGMNAVLSAYAQGSKIKIISSEFIGQNDTFWYVLADSPIKTIGDISGKSVGYPRPGGSGEAILLALKAERGIDFKSVATGGADASYVMAKTKQVDVAQAVPPARLDAVESGEIRVLFSGDDAQTLKNLTGRVIIARSSFLEERRPAAMKFMQVLDGCIDWAYANKPAATEALATLNNIDKKIAARSMEFYHRESLAFGPVKGMDEIMAQAVTNKFIERPLSSSQQKDLTDIIYSTKK